MGAILPFERSQRKRFPVTRSAVLLFFIIILWTRTFLSSFFQHRSSSTVEDFQSSYSLAEYPRPANFHPNNDWVAENDRVAGVSLSAPPKVYRPAPPEEIEASPPIIDNFPQAMHARSMSDLPPIPPWNTPPSTHVDVPTPLLIGFTRGWRMLQQNVLSYITAGWPPADIYVVDNTGTMNSNRLGLLSLQNPFFLNYTRLTTVFGVNVISTPTLLTFAQMQNFFTNYALEHDWPHYFWAHMDTVALSDEEFDFIESPFKSLYLRAVDAVLETYDVDGDDEWGMRWFNYDYLTLVRTAGNIQVGGWDTMIPFYQTDCDMHERVWMAGLTIWDMYAGQIKDTNRAFDDLSVLFYRDSDEDPLNPLSVTNKSSPVPEEKLHIAGSVTGDPADPTASNGWRPPSPNHTKQMGEPLLNGPHYSALISTLEHWNYLKLTEGDISRRNRWQRAQRGGQGEPFYRDADGFQRALDRFIELGWTETWLDKWGIVDCAAREAGLTVRDAWVVERGWREENVQKRLGTGEGGARAERDLFGSEMSGRARVKEED